MNSLTLTKNIDNEFDELLSLIISKLGIKDDSIGVLKRVFKFIKRVPIFKPEFARRRNGEPYETHLIETAKILLKISNNPTLDQVATALLHDSIEDLEDFDVNDLAGLFGPKIANGVEKISKKPIKDKEKLGKELVQYLKYKRNKEYCEKLGECDNFELDVKFADRIHNLRTLYGLKPDFINRVIDETCKYFLPLALEKNRKAYDLMTKEIIKLIYHVDKVKIQNILDKEIPRKIRIEELV